jgi:uncharacterized membrane protein
MLKSRRERLFFSGILLLLLCILLYFFNSHNRFVYNKPGDLSHINFERARITRVVDESLEKHKSINGLYRGTQTLEVEILTGEHRRELHKVKNYLSDLFNVYGKKGMQIIVSVDTAEPGNYSISVYNYYRAPFMYLLILMFFIVLVVIGRKKGIASIVSLIITFVCIVFLFIPMVYKGYSPVISSVLIAILATVITLFSITGWSIKTFSAILGTSLGLIIAVIISSIFGMLSHVSGFSTEEAETLIVIASNTNMNVSQLFFAGILISSLGAIMDVAMSVASSIYEVYTINPELTRKELFTSGINVGRDMMGTMSNTLILAFAGVSINSMILIYAYNVQYNQLMNMNEICIEIIQGISASIALTLTIPLVSFISSYLIEIRSTCFSKKRNKSPY